MLTNIKTVTNMVTKLESNKHGDIKKYLADKDCVRTVKCRWKLV